MIDFSDNILAASIRRGAILHSNMFRNIDHGKFFVVIGVSEDKVAGFFFINSKINKHLERSQELLNAQILIRKENYSFLSHDSFICATRFIEIKVSDIIASIRKEETKFIDDLNKEDVENVLNFVRGSNLFSKNTIAKYANR